MFILPVYFFEYKLLFGLIFLALFMTFFNMTHILNKEKFTSGTSVYGAKII